MSHRATVWAVKQKDISPLTKLVLILLADRHNSDTNRCDPSLDRIADDCGMAKSTVQHHIRTLVAKGLLTIIPRWNGPVQLTNFYSFNMGGGVESTEGGIPAPGMGGIPAPGTEPVSSNQEVILSHREAVKRVFDYYRRAIGKTHIYTLTDYRLKKGLSRLEECLQKTKGNLERAEGLMQVCVDTLAANKFFMGENKSNRPFNDWEDQLFGSESRMEKWLEEAQR